MRTIVLCLLVCLPALGISQGGQRIQEKKDKIEAERIAFITKELSLTSEEAQKFWPVYNAAQKEKTDLRKQKREAMKEHKKLEEMTDAEVQKAMDNLLLYKQKEVDLEKTYHAKYLAVLPVKKVAKLYRAEEKFKRMLLERLREHKGKEHTGGEDD